MLQRVSGGERPPQFLLVPAQSKEIWQLASATEKNMLVASCLGWGEDLPWSTDFTVARTLLAHVEIFWYECFAGTLLDLVWERQGSHRVISAEDIAYRLTSFLASVQSDDLCHAFVATHPKGCLALQALSERWHTPLGLV